MKLSDIKKFPMMGTGVRTDWGPGWVTVYNYYDKENLTSYQVFFDLDNTVKYASVTASKPYEILSFPKNPKDYIEIPNE